MPDKFIKINADFEFVHTSYDNFEIAPNGEFLASHSMWNGVQYSYWDIYSDKTIFKYKLPNLPESAFALFGLSNNTFTLLAADLIDHSELNSFSEINAINFSSDTYFYDVVNDYRFRSKTNWAIGSSTKNDFKKVNSLILKSQYSGRSRCYWQ